VYFIGSVILRLVRFLIDDLHYNVQSGSEPVFGGGPPYTFNGDLVLRYTVSGVPYDKTISSGAISNITEAGARTDLLAVLNSAANKNFTGSVNLQDWRFIDKGPTDRLVGSTLSTSSDVKLEVLFDGTHADYGFSGYVSYPGSTGPGWKIVEAYDTSTVTRTIPTPGDESNMSNVAFATANNNWYRDSVSVNDWIVLQSSGSPSFQLYIEYQSTSAIYFFLMPLGPDAASPDPFVTGGANISPPLFPAAAVGSGTGFVSYPGSTTTPRLVNIWADDDYMVMMNFIGSSTSPYFMYCGKLDYARSTDTSPFVIWDSPTQAYLTSGSSSYFNRVSPVDNSTLLSGGYSGWLGPAESTITPRDGLAGIYSAGRVSVTFSDASDGCLHGLLRDVRVCGSGPPEQATYNDKAYMSFVNQGAGKDPVVMPWDSETEWP